MGNNWWVQAFGRLPTEAALAADDPYQRNYQCSSNNYAGDYWPSVFPLSVSEARMSLVNGENLFTCNGFSTSKYPSCEQGQSYVWPNEEPFLSTFKEDE